MTGKNVATTEGKVIRNWRNHGPKERLQDVSKQLDIAVYALMGLEETGYVEQGTADGIVNLLHDASKDLLEIRAEMGGKGVHHA
jgi:hypothetical protein